MDERLVNFEANFSVLDRYGEDITDSSYITNPAIGRDQQIKELILVLLTPEKSAILIGKPGIGKTAIVEGLAYRIQKGDVPDALKGYKIINLKTASLLGTMPSGESKVQKMIDELKQREKVILFIDEIHMLIGATDSSSLDFANIFKEGLGRGSIKVVGATTTEEYERYILRDKAFTRRFQKIEVPEPTRDETIKIMMGTLPKFEKQTGRKMKYTPFIQERIMSFLVDITSEYKRVFSLGSRYPDVCLTLLKQAFSYTVYDNRGYMDIFDVRKAIENSKNIYPDVIKKELPNFDKMFNDIILEERGEKPVEEWRRESGPTRYEQDQMSNKILTNNNLKHNDVSNNLKVLESIPSIIDKTSLREEKPVKAILKKNSQNNLFAKIGSTSVSHGLKDRFNSGTYSKKLDDILLSSEIGVIKEEEKKTKNMEVKVNREDFDAKNITDFLLGKPIASTIEDKELPEMKEAYVYKSDNILDKENNSKFNNLILTDEKKSNTSNLKKEKENNPSYMPPKENINENRLYNNNRNNETLFGASMYDVKENNDPVVEKQTDIYGQLIVPDNNMVIKNGKILDNDYYFDNNIIGNFNNGSSNRSNVDTPSVEKKWKFIDDSIFSSNSNNNQNQSNSSNKNLNDDRIEKFINFNELNSKEYAKANINGSYINVENNNKIQSNGNQSNLTKQVDLSLNENDSDNDNYFDDFYDN